MTRARLQKKASTAATVLTTLTTVATPAAALIIHDPNGGVYAGECQTGSLDSKTCENFMKAVIDRGMSIVPTCNKTVVNLVGDYQCTDAQTGDQNIIHIEQPATQTFNDYGNFIKDLLTSYQEECDAGKEESHWFRNLIIIALVAVMLYALYRRRNDINTADIRRSCIDLRNQFSVCCNEFCRSLRDRLDRGRDYQQVGGVNADDVPYADDEVHDSEIVDGQHQSSVTASASASAQASRNKSSTHLFSAPSTASGNSVGSGGSYQSVARNNAL